MKSLRISKKLLMVALIFIVAVVSVYADTTPINGSVSISGNELSGQTLTATYSGNAGTNVTYKWFRASFEDYPLLKWAEITGQTNNTYTLTDDDVHKCIKVEVAASGSYSGTLSDIDYHIVYSSSTKLVELGNSNWEYNFNKNGSYSSNISGDASGTTPSNGVALKNVSGSPVSFSPAVGTDVLNGNTSANITTDNISLILTYFLSASTAPGISVSYDNTTHVVTIKAISTVDDIQYDSTTGTYAKKDGRAIGDVTTYYYVSNVWTTTKPTTAGTYNVGFSIAASDKYVALGSSTDVKTETTAKYLTVSPSTPTHTHSWKYTVVGDKFKATCEGTVDCSYKTTPLELTVGVKVE